jgi:hypothetical protein
LELFILLLWAHRVNAQIRVAGSFPLRVLQPAESASMKHAAAYNRTVIEATAEAAHRAGRLRNNLAAWEQLRRSDWEKAGA